MLSVVRKRPVKERYLWGDWIYGKKAKLGRPMRVAETLQDGGTDSNEVRPAARKKSSSACVSTKRLTKVLFEISLVIIPFLNHFDN